MKANTPILLIIVATGAFFSGAIIDGELSPHLPSVPNVSLLNYFDDKEFSFIQSAELSSQGQAIIDHAYIDFTIDTIKEGEFFKNIVSECIFRSDESFGGEIYPDDSIDDGICIICKLEGECKGVNEDFVDLPHGTRLGAINLLLATDGVFLTVDALGGRPNTAIIFDGDTPGGPTDTANEPDPDLRADGVEIDFPPNPENNLDGICSGCGGLHMIIIPENIDDDDSDNLVDTPNDSADGGTLKFQFAQSREIVSFGLVDMDRLSAAVHEARAYSDFSCTQLVDTTVFDPGSAATDGSVQTIDMNNVVARCLKIEVHDSFGITNLILECANWTAGGDILGVGRVNLDDGYTANEEIHIPIEGMVDVTASKHVAVEILSAILNFQGLSHGDVLNNQFVGAYGIKISGGYVDGNGDIMTRDPVVFDTELSGTSDSDLEVGIGNISIVQENTIGCGDGTCDDPDDNAAGGFQKFQFDPIRYVKSLVWIDADRPEPFGEIFFYSDYDCTVLIPQDGPNGGINIPSLFDGSVQVLVPVNIEQVGCMIADYRDSGGLSRLNLGCPLPEDPITMPWFQEEHQGSTSEESIFYTGFENYAEINEWSSTNSVSGDYFDIILDGGDWWAYAGSKVLAGWGNFDPTEVSYTRTPLDISSHHSVVVSIQYSYEDTEDADEFFFEYKNGANWIPIVNVPSPQSSSNQFPWTLVEVNVPDSINSLELQFRWSSSHDGEHLMIDSLEVFGIPN